LIQQNLHDIHQIIVQARDIPIHTEQKEHQIVPLTLPPMYDPESVLNCPHDLSHQIDQPASTTTSIVNNISQESVNSSSPITSSLGAPSLHLILDDTFKEQLRERLAMKATIRIKHELKPVSSVIIDENVSSRLNQYDLYLPPALRTNEILPQSIWKLYYPDKHRQVNRVFIQNGHNNDNKRKHADNSEDVEMMFLNKHKINKRKRKNGPQNGGRKQKRHTDVTDDLDLNRNVAEEIEIGEIIETDEADEFPKMPSTIKPFCYSAVADEELFKKKFKRPSDNEDIYDPNNNNNNKHGKRPEKKNPNRKKPAQQNKSMTYPFPKKSN